MKIYRIKNKSHNQNKSALWWVIYRFPHWIKRNYPSGKNNWKKFEKNNTTITLNILYAIKKKERYILPLFQKRNLKRGKIIVF